MESALPVSSLLCYPGLGQGQVSRPASTGESSTEIENEPLNDKTNNLGFRPGPTLNGTESG